MPSAEELQRLLPGYEVFELLSSEKTGALYRAQQNSLEREVTIVVLPPSLVKDDSQRKAFAADAKSTAKLNHPHLVNVYDSGDIEGMLYVIMEAIPGRSLHETTRRHAVDQMEGALLVIDLCQGLEHAHKAGIIHQAINPRNILINKNAEAKILDFGIAGLTGIDQADESSAYCAPEVFAESAGIDARTDNYSVGMIFYKLLTGHLPGDPYIPPSKASDSHTDFDRIVQRAIEHDPAKRYSSAGEMAQDITNLINKWKYASSQNTTHNMRTTPLESLHSLATGVKATKPSNLAAVAITLLVICIIAAAAYFVIKLILF